MVATLTAAKKSTKTQDGMREQLSTVISMIDSAMPADDDCVLLLLRGILLTDKREPRSPRNYSLVAQPLVDLQEEWHPLLAAYDFDRDGEARAMEAADNLACLVLPVHAEHRRLCREANRWIS